MSRQSIIIGRQRTIVALPTNAQATISAGGGTFPLVSYNFQGQPLLQPNGSPSGYPVHPPGGGLNFNLLKWGAPVIQGLGPGDSAAAAAVNNAGNLQLVAGNLFIPGTPQSVSMSSDGTLSYTGPDVACRCHLQVVDFTPIDGQTNCLGQIFVFQDGNLMLDLEFFETPDPIGSGDADFTIAAGVNSLITVFFGASRSAYDSNNFTYHVNYNITLTPAS